MKRSFIFLLVFCAVFLSPDSLHAQINENIWFDGLSRSYFVRDAVDKSIKNDTISPKEHIKWLQSFRPQYSCKSNQKY